MVQSLNKKRRPMVSPYESKNRPEWVKVLTACEMVQLGRTRFGELLEEAKSAIKTVVLKSPGANKGATLVHLPSLFGYIEALAAKQQMEAGEKGGSGDETTRG
jgi:hypothetical protein